MMEILTGILEFLTAAITLSAIWGVKKNLISMKRIPTPIENSRFSEPTRQTKLGQWT